MKTSSLVPVINQRSSYIINQAMPYLIDGHNLIPKVPGLSLKSFDDEIELIQRLQDFCRQTGKSVEVFFDKAAPGKARLQTFGRVKAHFVRTGRTADEAIIARLNRLGRGAKNFQVVSSDRQVAVAARSLQARVISSDDFAHFLTTEKVDVPSDPGTELEPSMEPSELQAWLDLFIAGTDDELKK